jgi:DNA-binding NarL/FixJ family response regulator
MSSRILIAILEDHQSIVDGYRYRLSADPGIRVVATGACWEEFEPLLASNPSDVLILDLNVPTSAENRAPFPVLHIIPYLLQQYPQLRILVISMYQQPSLIEALLQVGISGYIFKDDGASIQQLAKVVGVIASGGIYFSQGAYRDLRRSLPRHYITPRQLEVLSLCAAYPNNTTNSIAQILGVSGPTVRNLLSGAYLRLGVQTRAAAIAAANEMGIIPRSLEFPPNAGQDSNAPRNTHHPRKP